MKEAYRTAVIVIAGLMFISGNRLYAQSPHGDALRIDCASCHTADSWTINKDSITFHHGSTRFPLAGQHDRPDCRACHQQLDFSLTPNTCASCHLDVHQQTVGDDCARCHDPSSWLVNQIADIHRQVSFPLLGNHATAACTDCHQSETGLYFFPIGNDCITCHQSDYASTANPGHAAAGFTTDCAACHRMDAPAWTAEAYDHSFFPLTGGHDINECAKCHTGPTYSATPSDCFACHAEDYNTSVNPPHATLGLSTACVSCHTTDPGWMPAEFREHDNLYFPIYSGAHEGQWTRCADCHTAPDNYAVFTCITCHTNPETNEDHQGVNGYMYNNPACLACHPTGNADDVFDHGETAFPLTGVHATTECTKCHANGFTGTPTACSSCHQPDFDASLNPNHTSLGLSTDCAACHTTDPDWQPAQFLVHDQYYALNGAHALIANQCATCHQGDYNNTPNTCIGCHQADYIQTTNPNHAQAQFSTDCISCHSESSWSPSTFDHDNSYFPIYSGDHKGVWSACVDCHTTPGDFTQYTCVTCHTQGEAQDQHAGVSGYLYSSPACLACHPTGSADNVFDHSQTAFPLTGAHAQTDCLQCHAGGFAGTPTECVACHLQDHAEAANPNHPALGISTDCVSCHTTAPGWSPATFDNHNDYYPLNGAHAIVANQCAICHNGDYTNTPNTCAGCHLQEYTQTADPPHAALQFSTDCATCHTESAWSPSTFDHDAQHFPIYSGAHQGKWDECRDCHTTPGNYSLFTCVTCHVAGETNEDHEGVPGYIYESTACLACHPTGSGEDGFDHNNTAFALTGSHLSVTCLECHSAGFAGTPAECVACHAPAFEQSINPNHGAIGLPTDCAACHTTDPDWMPAQFAVHNQYYALNGAHAMIANQCATCHQGEYNNTPSTCVGCHQAEFNQTTNPSHSALQFTTECTTCHNESAWSPAGMPNHAEYYALNGAHAAIANECALCHNGNYANTPSTCVGCHQAEFDQTTNPPHAASGFNTECSGCHNENAWVPATFDHDAQYFPIYSGEHQGVWDQCTDCHTQPGNFSVFTCTTCHVPGETNEDHQGVNGYAYQSPLCLACHPTGSAENILDHSATNFPLTGAHTMVDCLDCHASGFAGTPTACDACHQPAYNQSVNPSHVALALPTDCIICHTTDPDWAPAQFPNHNEYYPLNGAHAAIANQCASCHNGNYNNTPATCVGCHQPEYNQTTDPPHAAIQFPTDCAACHTEEAWTPAEYEDHDNLYFPIYSGPHQGEWDQCSDCHTNANNYAVFSCTTCHTPSPTNQQHAGVSGYIYQNAVCLACHPTGTATGAFNHANSNFPLTGAHATVDCLDCHASGYQGTSTECDACHLPDYNQATNPSHINLNLSTDCVSCHTTEPNWNPALFPDHNSYYPLVGAHAAFADQCVTCHNGNYNNTPNTCVGCHLDDYNGTNDPDHQAANFPQTCETCHNQTAWTPSTWDHDAMYFPIYSGSHEDEWDQCTDCHTNPSNYSLFTCITCHTASETNADHNGVNGYQYNSAACLACHPNGEAD